MPESNVIQPRINCMGHDPFDPFEGADIVTGETSERFVNGVGGRIGCFFGERRNAGSWYGDFGVTESGRVDAWRLLEV